MPLRPLALTLALLALAACRVEPAADAPPGADTTAEAPAAPPVPAAPASGPPLPYVARGACPFECCVYAEWQLTTEAPVFAAPLADAAAFTLPAGTTVRADSGNVYVARPGLVVADAPFPVEETGDAPTLAAGDTLWVLDTIGEGYVHTWYRGEVYETSGQAWWWGNPENAPPGTTFPARLVRPAEEAWWAHVTLPDGRAGWLDMARTQVTGDDACG